MCNCLWSWIIQKGESLLVTDLIYFVVPSKIMGSCGWKSVIINIREAYMSPIVLLLLSQHKWTPTLAEGPAPPILAMVPNKWVLVIIILLVFKSCRIKKEN